MKDNRGYKEQLAAWEREMKALQDEISKLKSKVKELTESNTKLSENYQHLELQLNSNSQATNHGEHKKKQIVSHAAKFEPAIKSWNLNTGGMTDRPGMLQTGMKLNKKIPVRSSRIQRQMSKSFIHPEAFEV